MAKRGKAPAIPFLKWAGGKGRLLPFFEPLFPRKIAGYHEPFLGAGAVYFHLASTRGIRHASLYDVNEDLVAAFEVVRDELAPLVRELAKLRDAHSERAYYAARERFNEGRLKKVTRAAHLIYLNKTGFNGLYRVNSRGVYNVPMGRYQDPQVFSEEMIGKASDLLQGVTLEARDFEKVVGRAKKGDFVYLDPPYDPLNKTAYFTSYAAGGFGARDQERLAQVFRALDAKQVRVMLSNHATALVEDLYQGFDMKRIRIGRNINSDASKRGDRVTEVVVRNYDASEI